MVRTLDEYAVLPYRLEVLPAEEGGYLVSYPELPGCFAQVEAGEDVLAVAEDVKRAWLEVALADGDDIPLPQSLRDYSGRFVVRIPKSLHRRLAIAAEQEGVSLNAFVTSLLTAGLERAVVRGEERLVAVKPGQRPIEMGPPAADAATSNPAWLDESGAAHTADLGK